MNGAPRRLGSWTGFYIGVNGGAGSGTTQTSVNVGDALAGLVPRLGLTLPLPSPSQTFTGFLGGVQAGYNWQTGPFVLGVEGDFDGATFQGNTACILLFNCNVKHDWIGDIAARLGVVAFDKALVMPKAAPPGASATASRSPGQHSPPTRAGATLPSAACWASASSTPVSLTGRLRSNTTA